MSRSRWSSPLLFAVVLALALPAAAQTIPQPSPRARVEQTVGVTDFAVDYSSPAAKGRKIWGDLVPMDRVWRTGANQATKFTASRDFKFGDKMVPAGTYGLFTIPGEKKWTVILNSDVNAWGSYSYESSKDAARIEVAAEALPEPRERMTFIFSNVTDTSAALDLEWEKLRIRIPLAVDTPAQVEKSIASTLDDAWRPHFVAARYLLDTGGDMNRALDYVGKSIAIKPTWWNQWVKAQILFKQNKKKDAGKAAKEAANLGKGDTVFEKYFAAQVQKAAQDWK